MSGATSATRASRATTCLARDEAEDAASCYARALALDARRVDLVRCRDERLVGLYARLCQEHGERLGREVLLPEAWLAGIVEVVCDREWLAKARGQLGRRAEVSAAADPAERARRFAVWLYLDRATPEECDAERREEMAELCPELFARVIGEIARREARRGARLGFG
jgi:hypothetical protein